jgi:hypothetical protein
MTRNGLFPQPASHADDTRNFAKTFHKTPALVRHGVRCGKVTCHCHNGTLHGSYTFLRWRDPDGRQRRRYIRRADEAAVAAIVRERQSADRSARQAAAEAAAELRVLRRWLRDLEQGETR